MDYRNARGGGFDIPPQFTKYMHLLRYVGAILIIAPPVWGMLALLGLAGMSIAGFMLSAVGVLFGVVFYLMGESYNTLLDKDGYGKAEEGKVVGDD